MFYPTQGLHEKQRSVVNYWKEEYTGDLKEISMTLDVEDMYRGYQSSVDASLQVTREEFDNLALRTTKMNDHWCSAIMENDLSGSSGDANKENTNIEEKKKTD